LIFDGVKGVFLRDGIADGHVWRHLWKEMGVFGGDEVMRCESLIPTVVPCHVRERLYGFEQFNLQSVQSTHVNVTFEREGQRAPLGVQPSPTHPGSSSLLVNTR
jgi:hypothetical protein